jgi:CubicO group peptidase (beta-lactamase class C family)
MDFARTVVTHDGQAYSIEGNCHRRFAAVRDCFVANFTLGLETGAAVAVTHDGELVVDLWGGFSDRARTEPWRADTIVNMMSVSKAVSGICTYLLVDRGRLDPDAPVATYWPEFAAAGKSSLPLRFVLDHRAGLPFVLEPLPRGAAYEPGVVAAALARQAPLWPPGEAAGYHVLSQGFLLGEIIKRVTGKSLGTFFRDEIAEPLGLDYHIGLGPAEEARCAQFIMAEDGPLKKSLALPQSDEGRFWAELAADEDFNSPSWRRAEIPSSNGHGNARAVARLYGALVAGRIMSKPALARMATEQHNLVERYWKHHYHQGSGVVLNSPPIAGMGPNPRAFGHHGAGGAIGFGDPDAGLGFSYAMNRMHMPPEAAPRLGLIEATFAALGR